MHLAHSLCAEALDPTATSSETDDLGSIPALGFKFRLYYVKYAKKIACGTLMGSTLPTAGNRPVMLA
jgi:hypothetical protein